MTRAFNAVGVGTALKQGVEAIEGCWPNVRTVAQPSDRDGVVLRTACQNLRGFWQYLSREISETVCLIGSLDMRAAPDVGGGRQPLVATSVSEWTQDPPLAHARGYGSIPIWVWRPMRDWRDGAEREHPPSPSLWRDKSSLAYETPARGRPTPAPDRCDGRLRDACGAGRGGASLRFSDRRARRSPCCQR
jgi:hypothetical protein